MAQTTLGEWGGVGGDSPTEPQVLNPTATDTDGDGIPNIWEDANLLNKTNPADARSDFDLDGLTALQEYQLGLANPGYGKPLGKWTMSALPRPTGFTTATPSVTLIESASNGTLVARVVGKLTGSAVTTSYPYTWSAANGWGRIAEPAGYANVTSLTPLDVNSSGQVVGYFNSGGTKGFLYTPDANGGHTTVFYLNPGSAQTLGIPRRISDDGYIVGNEGSLSGRSIAVRPDGTEIISPGTWTSPIYSDVNDYGEFSGSTYNPLTGKSENFLAAEGYPIFLTWMALDDMEGLTEIWEAIPDIDPATISWGPYPAWGYDTYGPYREGSAIDQQNGSVVHLKEGAGAEFYWAYHYDYGESSTEWYSYTGFSQSAGGVNEWGEFAGYYYGGILRSYFGSYGTQYSYGTSISTNGLFFYDGDYHVTQSSFSIYRALPKTTFSRFEGVTFIAVA